MIFEEYHFLDDFIAEAKANKCDRIFYSVEVNEDKENNKIGIEITFSTISQDLKRNLVFTITEWKDIPENEEVNEELIEKVVGELIDSYIEKIGKQHPNAVFLSGLTTFKG